MEREMQDKNDNYDNHENNKKLTSSKNGKKSVSAGAKSAQKTENAAQKQRESQNQSQDQEVIREEQYEEVYNEEVYANEQYEEETYREDAYANEQYEEEAYREDAYVNEQYEEEIYNEDAYANEQYEDGIYSEEAFIVEETDTMAGIEKSNGKRPAQRANSSSSKTVRQNQRSGKSGSSSGTHNHASHNKTSQNGGKKPTKKKAQNAARNAGGKKVKRPVSRKKKIGKIILFAAEICLLLVLVVTAWAFSKVKKMEVIEIKEEEVAIDPVIQQQKEEGTSKLLGYKNVALFGVDSRTGQLEKGTLSDTIIIASINQDTKEVKLVSVYRDTWLNMSTDKYNKANAAYSYGGPKQAISMLNMNLDMDITEYVTIGFDGLIDVIDAVGGIEIDVKQAEIDHINSYQISMTGEKSNTGDPSIDLNAKGEPNYVAREGVDYIPITRAGVQTLNGTQATAYARVRYVGDDFERTKRQQTVIMQTAKKAMTLDITKLNKIADAVFPKISTSLKMDEILSLLKDIASYEVVGTSGFPFDGHYQGGRVQKAAVVIPVDLNLNVKLLHEFLFNDTEYEPTDTVKKCSQKIAADTGVSYNGE